MTEEKMESIITELVVNGGNARASALEAIQAARRNEMEKAEKLMEECQKALTEAHHFQTTLIQETLNVDKDSSASMLMVHGQDHLMDAMVVKDLALEMIEMYKIIHEIKGKGENQR